MSKFLLDTNIIIDHFAGDTGLNQLAPTTNFYIPSIVVGELYYGALKSAKIRMRLEELGDFIRDKAILSCDLATAKVYGHVNLPA